MILADTDKEKITIEDEQETAAENQLPAISEK